MEDNKELETFIKLWFIAISSISYCYLLPAQVSQGVPRLLSLLPVITAFFVLPLPLSTIHFVFPTFFFLVWLGNFKLLLFAFNRGPLSSKPRLPLLTFISIALFPIKPKLQSNHKISNPFPFSLPKPIMLPIKAVILIMIVHVYQYKNNLHWTMMAILHFSYMYIAFELGFALTACCVKLFLGFGFKIEPQFDEPYLATSLQDFWGRRWNLMASNILRVTVYNPIRHVIWPSTLSGLYGQMLAIFVTFVVSGLVHELMYLYLTRVRPTWEVTWFFVLHGVCTAIEVAVKKVVNGRFQLHRLVSRLLTLVLLLVTSSWFLYPQLLRNGVDVKIINEASTLLKLLGLDVSNHIII